MEKITSKAREKMEEVIKATEHEFSTIRTGRASPLLLANIKVEYYGSSMLINQLASISVPEARLILIQPWDKGANEAICKAILAGNLGFSPNTDGEVIRVPIPALTEERRHELDKMVKHKAEEHRVAIRNIRRDINHEIDGMKQNKEISEDMSFSLKDEIQELVDEHIGKIDKILAEKEKEIMET
ncbi:ribosome recycling factor [bacterium]|nr:ribosome recycling factor [bacterium]MBU1599591.1 ribosome recycling factor [bacterium]MBU2461705.1 ribosome recycling factor [bacterium]